MTDKTTSGQPEIIITSSSRTSKVESVPPPKDLKDKAAQLIGFGIACTFSGSVLLTFAFLFLLHFSPVTTKTYDGSDPSKIVKTEISHDYKPALELFKTVSSIISGPLGFVLGFYFRENQS